MIIHINVLDFVLEVFVVVLVLKPFSSAEENASSIWLNICSMFNCTAMDHKYYCEIVSAHCVSGTDCFVSIH